jgi:hypothetical protein
MIKPWEVKGVPWKTESAYWSWVRGVLRRGWSRHPVKLEYIKKNRVRVPNPNPNGRNGEVWGMECRSCKGLFSMPIEKKTRARIEASTGKTLVVIEINHLTAASRLRSKEDLGTFAAKLLFVSFSDLEPLCQTCHKIYSYAEKQGISYEQAEFEKKVMEIVNSGKVNEFLEERGIVPESNAKKRRLQVTEYLQEKL